MNQILIAAPISDTFKQALLDKGYELVYISNHHSLSMTNFQCAIGIITSNKLRLDQATLRQFIQLKWIARLGSGMEIIDTEYCDAHGIRYVNSPDGIANTVAEHVTGMLLSLLHNIHSAHHQIKSGLWIREENRGMELETLTVGIIGYGHTGSATAKKLQVFAKKILAYDKYKTGFGNEFVQEVTLAQLQQEADIISFHVPLNEETGHYYNAAFSEAMKKPHILINAARGAVADTQVILDGLKSGHITGACLDVVEEEKNIEEVLHSRGNVIQEVLKYKVVLTPHIAGYSHNAIEKMSAELLSQLQDIV